MTILRKSLFLVFLGLLILSSNFIVSAQNEETLYENNPDIQKLNEKIDSNKEKIESLQKAAEEYAQKIEEYKNKSATLKNQLALLDNQIIKLELDNKSTQLQIDKAKLEVESLDYQIDKEQVEIDLQKINLIEYIKLIDQNDKKSYLEILVINESFAEFFNQLSYLEDVQNNIQTAVDRLMILKQAIELQKAGKENQKQELDKLKIVLEQKADKLKEENLSKEVILMETKSSELDFQRLLSEAKQQENSIEANILDVEQEIKDKIAKLRNGNTSPNTTLVSWPTPEPHEITTYFHDPDYPFRYIFEHPALDIRAKQGSSIKAPAPGYVARAKNAGYGYSYIILIHDNGLSTVYGHVSKIYVKEDSYVNVGDVIALSGGMPGTPGAGNLTTGPHLHFEVRLNGIPVNPLEYLP